MVGMLCLARSLKPLPPSNRLSSSCRVFRLFRQRHKHLCVSSHQLHPIPNVFLGCSCSWSVMTVRGRDEKMESGFVKSTLDVGSICSLQHFSKKKPHTLQRHYRSILFKNTKWFTGWNVKPWADCVKWVHGDFIWKHRCLSLVFSSKHHFSEEDKLAF